jgi:hypothetical protein
MSSKTERAELLFRVSEYSDGSCFISTELIREPGLTVLPRSSFIGFDLTDPSIENARRVADFLNQNIRWTTTTLFDDHPMFSNARTRYINGNLKA